MADFKDGSRFLNSRVIVTNGIQDGDMEKRVWNFRPSSPCMREMAGIRGMLAYLRSHLDPKGKSVIPLGYADPSPFECYKVSKEAEDSLVEAIRSGHYNGYAPAVGLPEARRAVAEYLSPGLPYKLGADDIYLTCGCRQAMDVTVAVLGGKDANILLPRPSASTMDSNLLRSCSAKIVGAFLITFLFCGAMELEAVQAQDFDFFYLVQQWPGSYCNRAASCCYPSTGKPPSDFSIHGLWPNYNDGRYPSNCDSTNSFDSSQISDLIKEMNGKWPSLACPSSNSMTFWEHEWEKHGTCSESLLAQHDYFATALRLKESVDLLGVLEQAGIRPDGGEYSLSSIQDAVQAATGYSAGIECNTDESGNGQLYQIYLCVDSSASNFISCTVLPSSKCSSQVLFPTF